MEAGLLLVRLAVGLTVAAHGAQKLFGVFGGHGLGGTAQFLDSLRFRPGAGPTPGCWRWPSSAEGCCSPSGG